MAIGAPLEFGLPSFKIHCLSRDAEFHDHWVANEVLHFLLLVKRGLGGLYGCLKCANLLIDFRLDILFTSGKYACLEFLTRVRDLLNDLLAKRVCMPIVEQVTVGELYLWLDSGRVILILLQVLCENSRQENLLLVVVQGLETFS